MTDAEPSRHEKLTAAYDAVQFKPGLGIAIVALSFITALLEGAGVGFLLPIIEIAQSPAPSTETDGLLGAFVRIYAFLGVPFSLEYLIVGLAGVMGLRFGLTFLTSWLRAILGLSYQRNLRERLFDSIMYGPIEYIDQTGSDNLLNGLITETSRAGSIVMIAFNVLEVTLRGLVYLAIASILSPWLTIVAVVSLGSSTLLVKYALEPAYAVGDRAADINDRIQTISQASIQGMRDVRLFNLRSEYVELMHDTLDQYVSVNVRLRRNQAALSNLNQFMNALVVFGLVYVGFAFTGLSIARLGVFLFAIFRLSPVLNQMNQLVYTFDSQLPHMIRVRDRLADLSEQASQLADSDGQKPVRQVERVEFDDVSFSYGGGEQVLRNVSLSVERGETVALVGPSGVGKSTIIALLGRLQTPDAGTVRADDTPIGEFEIESWRDRLAVVRQDPFLFNGTLRENVTVGRRDAPSREVERVCEIAQVTEFLSDLPDGYDTDLGEDGVRLSGGQKQRVAIARALLKDADVLVLDEATSELDSGIEQAVYEGIRTLRATYATITIAHRLSTVNDADRIYTLVDGTVEEVGTHDELLAREGVYADLYATQS